MNIVKYQSRDRSNYYDKYSVFFFCFFFSFISNGWQLKTGITADSQNSSSLFKIKMMGISISSTVLLPAPISPTSTSSFW